MRIHLTCAAVVLCSFATLLSASALAEGPNRAGHLDAGGGLTTDFKRMDPAAAAQVSGYVTSPQGNNPQTEDFNVAGAVYGKINGTTAIRETDQKGMMNIRGQGEVFGGFGGRHCMLGGGGQIEIQGGRNYQLDDSKLQLSGGGGGALACSVEDIMLQLQASSGGIRLDDQTGKHIQGRARAYGRNLDASFTIRRDTFKLANKNEDVHRTVEFDGRYYASPYPLYAGLNVSHTKAVENTNPDWFTPVNQRNDTRLVLTVGGAF